MRSRSLLVWKEGLDRALGDFRSGLVDLDEVLWWVSDAICICGRRVLVRNEGLDYILRHYRLGLVDLGELLRFVRLLIYNCMACSRT